MRIVVREIKMKVEKITCDVCKKEIEEGHQQRYMIVVTIGYPHAYNDGGSCAAVDRLNKTYHLHFDCSKKMFDACPQIVPAAIK